MRNSQTTTYFSRKRSSSNISNETSTQIINIHHTLLKNAEQDMLLIFIISIV